MKTILTGTILLFTANLAHSAPVIYTDEALFLAQLESLGYRTIHESFEDDIVWANSRNSIITPGSSPSILSQDIIWTSNYSQNNIASGTVGGYTADGLYALYSLPHGMTTDSGLYCDSAEDPFIPLECYQNDGIKVESASGELLYAIGGHIDTSSNSAKITFLLDGVDVNANNTDNIDNWQREGDLAGNWSFIGIIDTEGFTRAELRELTGKDFQQVLIFNDFFTLAVKGSGSCAKSSFNTSTGNVHIPCFIVDGMQEYSVDMQWVPGTMFFYLTGATKK